MYKVKVVGTYVARSGVMEKEKIKKRYDIEGVIPTTYAALSIVKNKLLAPALAKKYPDYVTFLTYHIVELTPLDKASAKDLKNQEITFMSRSNLLGYIKENAIKISPEYYPNLFRLREAVQFAKSDPDGYAKHLVLKEADLKLDLEMAKCNPGLFKDESDAGDGLIASVDLETKPSSPSSPSKFTKASSPEQLDIKIENRLKGMTAEMIKDKDLEPMDNVPSTDAPLEVGDL